MHIRELLTEIRLVGKFMAFGSFVRAFKFSGPGTAAQEKYMADVLLRLKENSDNFGFEMTEGTTFDDLHSMQSWNFMSPETSSLRSAGQRAHGLNEVFKELVLEIQKTIPEFTGWSSCIPYYLKPDYTSVSLGSPHELQHYVSGEESLDRFLTNTGLIDKIGRDQIVSGD